MLKDTYRASTEVRFTGSRSNLPNTASTRPETIFATSTGRSFGRTDKFYLKQYEEETNLVCNLLLDTSESMAYQSADAPLSKLEYAKCVAAALSYLVLHQQDSIGLATFDREIRALSRPSSNPSQLNQVLHLMEEAAGERKTETGPIFHDLAERFRKRGIVIVLSDLFDDVPTMLAGLKHLRHKRHEVVLFHVLDPAELEFPFRRMTDVRGSGRIAQECWPIRQHSERPI